MATWYSGLIQRVMGTSGRSWFTRRDLAPCLTIRRAGFRKTQWRVNRRRLARRSDCFMKSEKCFMASTEFTLEVKVLSIPDPSLNSLEAYRDFRQDLMQPGFYVE